MANILIFTELSGEHVKSVTLEMLGKLSGHSLDVVTIGKIADESKSELARFGASNIHSLKGDKLENYTPEGYSQAIKNFMDGKSYDYVFAGATSLGKDLLPRLSGMFDAGMAADVVNFTFSGDEFEGTRPMFAGKCLAKVKIQGPKPHFVTIRPNALGLTDSPTAGSGNLSEQEVDAGEIRALVKEIIKGKSGKLDLTEANVIVSGGRAMKNRDNFKILDELADVLGATVGASRAAVDAEYADHSMQVGQTGKTVSPSLYIACGISGAIQHLAGMRTSKTIVAINNDPDAPIFTKADYGIVGDLFKIVPILTQEIKSILG
ncbi:MAG: electron transfer flavoprotein subunit alpha/FixB family protein [Bacteriovoracaceae bacterium]|nr:electron transfer flavoprotein subunit alpha/FixB family protein [Bacteriovoracaceae bacterium]